MFSLNDDSQKQEHISASSVIVTNNVSSYMDKIWIGLLISLLFVLISEIAMFCILRFIPSDFENDITKLTSLFIPNFEYFKKHIIIPNCLCWIFYFVFKILFHKATFKLKKVCICSVYLLCATIYAFEHIGFNFLSVLYCIPLILSCPLGKKSHISVFFSAILLHLAYTVYHFKINPTIYDILVAALTLMIIVAIFFITVYIYNTLMTALSEVKNYEKLNTDLKIRLYHDNLTRAYSKSALMNESKSISAYSSIAFIDLDNFKSINDTYGHDIGDEILKTLVRTFQNQGENVFRYGGDEFIVLSHLLAEEACEKIKKIKKDFIHHCETQYHMTATFSAGIVEIKANTDLNKLLKESDNLMYNAKNSGRNRIVLK
ncbi:MAG: GGDEF domain-containing protein [Treponema sp.]|nr:GGDEF domain-containing protein [Treponema sp.]